ncbi:MAG: hypothetical protein LBH28_03520 [Oscillospiraceae bacterium]|nr:hypothetical protein [Oscillospiraceae bacterium]
MNYLYAIIGVVIIFNFYMLFARRGKSRKMAKRLADERKEAERHSEVTKHRLYLEQEDAARHVEMQKKTFELYEQVRNKNDPL